LVKQMKNGKIDMSLDEFDRAFRTALGAMPSVSLNAKISDLKTNPVTPAIGPLVIDAETWHKRWKGSAENAAGDWEERALTPSGDPIARAIAANKKRIDRFNAAEKAGKWLGTMNKRKFSDYADGVSGAGADGYKSGISAKEAKTKRRIQEIQPKVAALKKAIQDMPDDTDSNREKRMLAARRGMLAIGGAPATTAT